MLQRKYCHIYQLGTQRGLVFCQAIGLAMLPHLVFDQLCNSSIVDHVLFSHIGPISKFQCIQEFEHIRDIDRWILHLSRHSISEFILEIWYGGEGRYALPSCIFSCQDMIHLKLSGCLLKPPSTFKRALTFSMLSWPKMCWNI